MFKPNLNKIILCATAKQLVAGIWHADKLQQHLVFLHDESNQQAFKQWLALYPNIPIYLIANAVEEDYRLEHLPHSSGGEKRELITRKLNQFYRGLIFRTAHFIGREKDKRKDDQFLFAALNNDDFLESWLQLIQELDGELVGVYLLPMLSQSLCHKPFYAQKQTPTHTLLCEKLSSGLRQTYLYNGQLRMSRLIPDVPEDPSQLGYFYLVETQKTRLYLMSKRFISRDVTLHLLLVSLDDHTQEIQQSFRQEPGIDCEMLPASEIIRNIHIQTHLLKQSPELLHMQLLAMGQQVDNLAPEALTRTFQLGNVSYWSKITSAVLVVLGVIITTYFLLLGLEYQTQFENAKVATEMLAQRYREQTSNAVAASVLPVQAIQNAVILQEKIEQYPKTPLRAFQALSAGLDNMPEVHLRAFQWQQTNAQTLNGNTTAPTQNATSAPLEEWILACAEIQPFAGDYRVAKEKAQQLIDFLQKNESVAQVEIVEQPSNSNAQQDLRGSTATNSQHTLARAVFKIKLKLKANPS
jgi:hypothetical protein